MSSLNEYTAKHYIRLILLLLLLLLLLLYVTNYIIVTKHMMINKMHLLKLNAFRNTAMIHCSIIPKCDVYNIMTKL